MNTNFLSRTSIAMSVVMLVTITCAVETDIFLPSFPAMQEYFATTESKIQLLISMNFIGLFIASLFYGPLADAYGRRPILLTGMFVFTFSSIACALANSLDYMLFWRFMQGLGSSVAFVVPKTIVRDHYDREQAANVLGIYGSAITLSMSFAPIIGNYLYLTFSWHANFTFVAVLASITFIAALFFVPETLHKEKRTLWHGPSILKSYKKLLTTPKAMAILYLCCIIPGAYFVYIANLSILFINYLHVTKEYYGYYQAIILLILATGRFCAGMLIKRLGIKKVRMLGGSINVFGAILLLGVGLVAEKNALLITLAMSIFTLGFSLNMGIFSGDYINTYPKIRGTAASLGGSIGLLVTLAYLFIAVLFFNGSILPIAIIIFLSGISSFGVLLWLHYKYPESN